MIKELIKQTLLIPVIDEPQAMPGVCATYENYSIAAGVYGDGVSQEYVELYQIDLWYGSRNELDAAVKKLRSALTNASVYISSIDKSCDPVTKRWRATFKIEKEESGEENGSE